MRSYLLAGAGLAIVSLVAVAVGDGGPQAGTEANSVEAAGLTPPDTTAEALWSYLREESYRDSWKLWPGKGRLYTGREPHGMLLTTYANDVAYQALLNGKAADLPGGSILVKENYMPDSTFAAATVMYKVEGYNPDHQDWLFAKYDPNGKAEAFGRTAGCQACHQAVASNGYIYTPVGNR